MREPQRNVAGPWSKRGKPWFWSRQARFPTTRSNGFIRRNLARSQPNNVPIRVGLRAEQTEPSLLAPNPRRPPIFVRAKKRPQFKNVPFRPTRVPLRKEDRRKLLQDRVSRSEGPKPEVDPRQAFLEEQNRFFREHFFYKNQGILRRKEGRGSSSQKKLYDENGKCVGVFNIRWNATEFDLKCLFENFGTVRGVRIIRPPRKPGRKSSGYFAFIYYSSEKEARTAQEEAHGMGFQGRIIRVELSERIQSSQARSSNNTERNTRTHASTETRDRFKQNSTEVYDTPYSRTPSPFIKRTFTHAHAEISTDCEEEERKPADSAEHSPIIDEITADSREEAQERKSEDSPGANNESSISGSEYDPFENEIETETTGEEIPPLDSAIFNPEEDEDRRPGTSSALFVKNKVNVEKFNPKAGIKLYLPKPKTIQGPLRYGTPSLTPFMESSVADTTDESSSITPFPVPPALAQNAQQ